MTSPQRLQVMPVTDPISLIVIFAALALGGTLKGATGAGAPVIAVPVMAAYFDVRLAVMMMALPNLVTNIVQCIEFWKHLTDRRFAIRFAVAGATGVALGTLLLAAMPSRALTFVVALAVVAYVGLRILQPGFRLSMDRASKLSLPLGLFGGILQGAGGISAPISISFLNAMRLERSVFIGTISVFFFAMAAAQIPTLFATNLMTLPLLGLSGFAVLPMLLFMPVGAWAARHISHDSFDRLTLAVLSVLAMRLFYTSLF